ncbi:MAG: GNAT family N-acetyltransferase [Phenylobacterium sp.]|uniref:GNAT family N-acetyltransferase n=1 Tax=Phenylobacterium sp. TaxID=1871053 RepID=UPI002732EF08|nr:GNAT family N-acetyltransferase [Phenylobacterium sp.]MDP3173077.1 GNAT family N-acetyltransferase [Phenylobacterium sp.]
MIDIREDDLSGEAVRALITLHLAGMQADSTPGDSFALDLSGLESPDITVWSAWRGGALMGIAALKALADGGGEIKSMRTDPAHLRQGAAAALLDHIIAEAQRRGYHRLSLETGRGAAFEAALALYARRGFTPGGAFADYPDYGPGDFNQFLHLDL